MNARWDQIQTIFQGCIECSSAELATYLNDVCGGDHELQRQVECLLEHDRNDVSRGFLSWPDKTTKIKAQQLVEPGDVLGNYRIEQLIGSGSSGEVFRATHLVDGSVVAIKILRPWQSDDSSLARFQREAEALARISHPNIAALIDSGWHDKTPFIAMELVDGESLSAKFQKSELPDIRTRMRWFSEICCAVAAAHESMVLHRDLKPSNVLIGSDGKAVVTDFGLAKFVGCESKQAHLTTTGRSLGTPRFMAPEQFNSNSNVGMTTDVYGLGALLYFLLSGKPPFESANIFEVAGAVFEQDPRDPRAIDPTIDRDLSTICLHCLKKKPVDRYQTVSELIEDIDNWQANLPISVRPTSSIQQIGYWTKRNPVIATLTSMLIFAITSGLIGTTWMWQHSEKQKSKLLEINGMFSDYIQIESSDLPSLNERHEMLQSISSFVRRIFEPIRTRFRYQVLRCSNSIQTRPDTTTSGIARQIE